jgi:hypothetical protein
MTATQHPSAADDQASTPDRHVGTPAREPNGTRPQWAKNDSIPIADKKLDGRRRRQAPHPVLGRIRVEHDNSPKRYGAAAVSVL